MARITVEKEPIEERRPIFRKPLKVMVQESWQDFVNSFMLSICSMIPKKRSRCLNEGHVMPTAKGVYSRCVECGASIVPGSTKIRACEAAGSKKAKSSLKMHIWPDE